MGSNKLVLSLVALFASCFLAVEATITKTSAFDNYINVINKLTSSNDRLRLLEAVWGEIRAERQASLTQIKVFYEALQNFGSAQLAELERAAELSSLVREVLVVDNGRLLAETLNNEKAAGIDEVAQYRQQLYADYDAELLSAIFEAAINSAYAAMPTDKLYEALITVDLKVYNPELVFRVRVNWNLYLYWKFLGLGDVNDNYAYQAAMALRNFKHHDLFAKLSSDSKRRIDLTLNTFDDSVKALLVSSIVCLENKAYTHNYLYFPSANINPGGNSVQAIVRSQIRWPWYNNLASKTGAITSSDMFYLSSYDRNWHLYRIQSNANVLVREKFFSLSDAYWTPRPRYDSLIFEFNGSYMCATTEYDNKLGGFLVKTVKPVSMDDNTCRWKVTDCADMMQSA